MALRVHGRTTALIVTYQSADFIESCLRSLFSVGVDRAIVVDNASREDERVAIENICSNFPDVQFVGSSSNLGFGAGINLAASIAGENVADDDYFWIVNPDTEIRPGCLDYLQKALDSNGLDIVSPTITAGVGEEEYLWFFGGEIDNRAIRTKHLDLGGPPSIADADRECNFLTGAAMFMKFSTWRSLGGFDESYFLYWEDAELCRRASSLGMKMGTVASARVWHMVGGSGDRTGKSETYYYFMQRNRFRFLGNSSAIKAMAKLPFLMETLRLSIRPLKQKRGRLSKWRAGLRGLGHGLKSMRSAGSDPVDSLGNVSDKRGIFLSWTTENGRSRDLARSLDLELGYVRPRTNLTLFRYVISFVATFKISVLARQEKFVFLMLPPTPALVAVIISRIGRLNTCYFDLHTGFFYDPKWSWARDFSLFLMRRSTAIVTNENLAEVARSKGVERVVVLHDWLTDEHFCVGDIAEDYVLCPVSYANDEPIGAMLSAAGQNVGIKWIFTGRAPDSIKEIAPENVEFSGFVSDEDYEKLLSNARLVLALTNRKDTMQRGGYEALMRGIPLVTSDFPVLRDFFQDAAVYVELGERDLRDRVSEAWKNSSIMRTNAQRVLSQRIEEQRGVLEVLKSELTESLQVSCGTNTVNISEVADLENGLPDAGTGTGELLSK